MSEYDDKCRKCTSCASEYWCCYYQMNPYKALEECKNDDYEGFEEKTDD